MVDLDLHSHLHSHSHSRLVGTNNIRYYISFYMYMSHNIYQTTRHPFFLHHMFG